MDTHLSQKIEEKKDFQLLEFKTLQGTLMIWAFIMVIILEKIEINDGDILISWSASLGVYIWNRGKALLNQHIFKVIPKPFVDRYFLYYLLKSLKATFTAIASNKQTTGLGHITLKDLKKLNIALPSEKDKRLLVVTCTLSTKR